MYNNVINNTYTYFKANKMNEPLYTTGIINPFGVFITTTDDIDTNKLVDCKIFDISTSTEAFYQCAADTSGITRDEVDGYEFSAKIDDISGEWLFCDSRAMWTRLDIEDNNSVEEWLCQFEV